MNEEIETKYKLYARIIEALGHSNIDRILLVDIEDTLFGSMVYEYIIKMNKNVKIDLLVLDTKQLDKVRLCGWFEHVEYVLNINAIHLNGLYDVIIFGSSLKKYSVQDGLTLISNLIKNVSMYLLFFIEDFYENDQPSLSFSNLESFDFSFYQLKSLGVNQQLYKIFPQKEINYIAVNELSLNVEQRLLSITFVVPHAHLTGGLKMLYEQMKHLQVQGHKINVISKTQDKSIIPDWLNDFRPDNEMIVPLEATYLDYIKDCDMIIIGFITQLNEIQNTMIPVFYWEQGYEFLFGDYYNSPNESQIRVNLSQLYDKDFYLASDSIYVRNVIRSRYNKDSFVLPNYIDTNFYYPLASKVEGDVLSILLIGNPSLMFKGFEKALTGLVAVYSLGYRFRVVWVCQSKPETSPLPFEIDYIIQPTQQELARIYRESDILLSCSLYEGCPMPPLEAMASGVAVIATDNGGIKQYAMNEYNAILVDYGNHSALVHALVKVLSDKKLRDRLINNGLQTAKELSYQKGVLHLEKLLLNIIATHKEIRQSTITNLKFEAIARLKYIVQLLCYCHEFEYLSLLLNEIQNQSMDKNVMNEVKNLIETYVLETQSKLSEKLKNQTISSDELFDLASIYRYENKMLEAMGLYTKCISQTSNELMRNKIHSIFKDHFGLTDSILEYLFNRDEVLNP